MEPCIALREERKSFVQEQHCTLKRLLSARRVLSGLLCPVGLALRTWGTCMSGSLMLLLGAGECMGQRCLRHGTHLLSLPGRLPQQCLRTANLLFTTGFLVTPRPRPPCIEGRLQIPRRSCRMLRLVLLMTVRRILMSQRRGPVVWKTRRLHQQHLQPARKLPLQRTAARASSAQQRLWRMAA